MNEAILEKEYDLTDFEPIEDDEHGKCAECKRIVPISDLEPVAFGDVEDKVVEERRMLCSNCEEELKARSRR